MKYCVVLAEGIADRAQEELEGKTPLEVARTPNLDRVSMSGRQGTLRTVPEGMEPADDVAIMSVLGIDPAECHSGRGALEAASMGVELEPNDVAFCCSLVTVDEETLVDFRAGGIRSAEGKALITALAESLGTTEVSFHPGRGHRHLMVYHGPEDLSAKCTSPREIAGKEYARYLPRGPGAELLRSLIEHSQAILQPHDVNAVRIDHGENPATMIWLWGGGKAPRICPFAEQFGKTGAAVSASDLVRGIGCYLGFDLIDATDADECADADYAAAAEAGIRALEGHDLAVAHVEATGALGPGSSVEGKIKAIEDVDAKLVGPILDAFLDKGDFRVLVTPAIVTPVGEGAPSDEPVPFAMCGTDVQPVHELPFSERSAAGTGLKIERGHELMAYFLRE